MSITELIQAMLQPAYDAAQESGIPTLVKASDAAFDRLDKVFNAVEPYTDRLPISFASEKGVRASEQRAFQLGVEIGVVEGASALRRMRQRPARNAVEAAMESRKNERRQHLHVV